MNPNPIPPGGGLVRWIYRLLLKLYPAAFRRRYEEEMLQAFDGEWSRASGAGLVACWRCGLHLAWDFLHTALGEWVVTGPAIGMMTVVAVALGVVCISFEPMPPLLKALGCACLTATFAVVVMAVSGRTRSAQLKLAALGLPVGLALAPLLHLNPLLAAPPDTPLMPVTEPALTGRVVYQRMAEVYRNARTYVDHGESQTTYAGVFGHAQIRPFETAFVRDGGFRYEFRDQFNRLDAWKEYVIWKDGPLIKRWWTIEPQVVVGKDLAYALGGAAGVSGLTSTQIPELLQPGSRGDASPNAFSQIILLGHQRVDGIDMFKLQLVMARVPDVMMWINSRTYLINRTSFSNTLRGGLRSNNTIIYHPQLNVPVGPARLTFQPPSVRAGWMQWAGGEIYAMIFASAVTWIVALLNLVHRRTLRKRWRGKEVWLAPMMKRTYAGYLGIVAICVGMWLGGTDLDGTLRNLLLAQFAMHGGFMLYVIHRRSKGYARFSPA